MREWFEPNVFVYLATIIQRQHADANFRHERVLLFHDESDLAALKTDLLDGHYAHCFCAIHTRLEIPLSYLRPDDAKEILAKLDPAERSRLASYQLFGRFLPWWLSWPARFFKKASRLRSFVAITKQGQTTFLKFSKDKFSLETEPITNADEIRACKALLKGIEEVIYKRNTTELWDHREFCRFLRP